LAELFDTPNVLLQGRSPSCAVHTVHDGTFMRKLVRAKGMTAALPGAKGLTLFTLAERAELLRNLNR
ncbi:MAG: hypothetical protein JW971_05275, partial [Synergistales bacterium]|nr:hypothetical protein [Synergistales bacterium]